MQRTKHHHIYTPSEAAAIVGLSVATIRAEIKSGGLTCLRFRSNYRIPACDLEAWIQSRYRGRSVRLDRDAGELVFGEPSLVTS